MRKRFTLIPILIFLMVIMISPLKAQDFEDIITKYTGENGQGFMQPLASSMGANLNSGLFSTAHIPRMGFRFRVGVKAMVAFVSDKQKTFEATTPDLFFPVTTAEVPTVFGDTESTTVQGQGGTEFTFPGGLDLKMMPLAVPQLTIGAVFGTEAIIRWFAYNVGEDFGSIKLFGFGLRHSVSQYLPILPLDVAAGFFIQSFEIGDEVKANTFFMGVQGSYKLSILTLYGGMGVGSSKMDVAFTIGEGEDQLDIAYDLKGKGSVRFTVGFAVQLLILRIHADYNIGYQNVACAGVSFGM